MAAYGSGTRGPVITPQIFRACPIMSIFEFHTGFDLIPADGKEIQNAFWLREGSESRGR